MNNLRYSFFAIILAAMFALAACSPAQPAAAPTSAPAAVPANPTTAPAAIGNEVTINLGAGRDADQSPGTAVLTAQGDKTQVVVTIKPGAAGVAQPGHIHEGSCPGVGAVKFSLTSAMDGKSTTVINSALKDLMAGGLAINFHKSAQELSVYVACGNIK